MDFTPRDAVRIAPGLRVVVCGRVLNFRAVGTLETDSVPTLQDCNSAIVIDEENHGRRDKPKPCLPILTIAK
jgi:hypothetical protein